MPSTQWCPGCSRVVDGPCHHFHCAIGPYGLAARQKQDRRFPWIIAAFAIGGMAIGALIFAAGAGFMKLFG